MPVYIVKARTKKGTIKKYKVRAPNKFAASKKVSEAIGNVS